MTFETKWECGRSFQEPRVRGAMGYVTSLAAVYSHRKMFKRKGSALVGVTFQARFLVGKRLVHHARSAAPAPRGYVRAVGIVAVRTLHEAFVDTVFERHRKLRPNIRMAGVAKVGLVLCQQCSSGGRLMNGMAVGTNNIRPGMV